MIAGRILRPPAPPSADCAEAELQALIVDLARWCGWLVFHVRDSRGSLGAGYPDLTLVRPATRTAPARLLFAEIKSATGRLSPEQREWGRALAAVPGIDYRVWRPEDWLAVYLTLTGEVVDA